MHKVKILGSILNSFGFWIALYAVSLILFAYTDNVIILGVGCAITLFLCLAASFTISNDANSDKEKEEMRKTFGYVQWIAIISILFILQQFMHIFD